MNIPRKFLFSNYANILVRRFKHQFVLNENAQEFFDSGNKYRYHPGNRRGSLLKLPLKLELAANVVINRYRNKNFRRSAHKVNDDFLRVLPVDEQQTEVSTNYRNIKFDESFDYRDYEKQKESITLKETRRYYQREFYNEHECASYMAVRLAPNFSALSYIFNEIRLEEPEFTPKSVFDFGSGVGTTIWAADEYWKNNIQEYFCVDLNENMNQLCRELLQKGTTNDDSVLDRTFYRQYLPAKHIPSYDLVVSAFSLLELEDTRSRMYVVENLWQKTNGLLVLLEHGSKAGFAAIMEARNFLLQINKNQIMMGNRNIDSNDSSMITNRLTRVNGSILAPCPHDLICPKQTSISLKKKSFCNFEVPYQQLDYGQESPGIKSERFTFLVMKKYKNQGQFHWNEEQKNWAKIIEPVIRKSRHAICRICDNDGQLKQVIVSKSKSSKDLYRCIKSSRWGDKVPASVVQTDDKPKIDPESME